MRKIDLSSIIVYLYLRMVAVLMWNTNENKLGEEMREDSKEIGESTKYVRYGRMDNIKSMNSIGKQNVV